MKSIPRDKQTGDPVEDAQPMQVGHSQFTADPAAANTYPQNATNAARVNFLNQTLQQDAASNHPESILGLPDDVKKNIVGYEDMELDELLLRIIGSFSAALPTDRIILYLYTTYQKAPPRAKVLARLRLLCASGVIFKKEGIRGTYSAAAALVSKA